MIELAKTARLAKDLHSIYISTVVKSFHRLRNGKSITDLFNNKQHYIS